LAKYGKKYKEGKFLQIKFPISILGILLSSSARYGPTLFTLSIAKCRGDVATLTRQRKGDVSRVGGSGSEGDRVLQ
jgi:hypothetical protein